MQQDILQQFFREFLFLHVFDNADVIVVVQELGPRAIHVAFGEDAVNIIAIPGIIQGIRCIPDVQVRLLDMTALLHDALDVGRIVIRTCFQDIGDGLLGIAVLDHHGDDDFAFPVVLISVIMIVILVAVILPIRFIGISGAVEFLAGTLFAFIVDPAQYLVFVDLDQFGDFDVPREEVLVGISFCDLPHGIAVFQHVADDLEILRQVQILKFLAVPTLDFFIIQSLLFGFFPQLLIKLLRVRAEIFAHDDALIGACCWFHWLSPFSPSPSLNGIFSPDVPHALPSGSRGLTHKPQRAGSCRAYTSQS